MWRVSCCELLFRLLLEEPDGAAGSVDGLEVGLGSLVWDWMPRDRIIQEGCTDFWSEILTLPFSSVADFTEFFLLIQDKTSIRLCSGVRSLEPGPFTVM